VSIPVIIEVFFFEEHLLECGIKNVHATAAEIRGQDIFFSVDFSDGRAFVNGSICGIGLYELSATIVAVGPPAQP